MELRRYKIGPLLQTLQARQAFFTDGQIVDMLNRAETIGFRLDEPRSPLEDLTLAELELLTREAGNA